MSNGTYEYNRYMRDGSVKKKTAVIRSRNRRVNNAIKTAEKLFQPPVVNVASRKLEEISA